MDFQLDEEYEALRDSVRRFASETVAPVIAGYYEHHTFPYELVRQMGKMGLFGLAFGVEEGGMGGDYLALCLAIEELARIDSSVAVTLEAGVSVGAMSIHRYGTPRQRERWMPSLARGEALAAFGLTEPGTGSDAAAIRTRAVLVGDEWVINGAKAFITNSGTDMTSLIVVAAVTGTKPGGDPEISMIILPSGTAGLTVEPGYSKVGWCASDTHGLIFEDCRVPAENLLGERGRGLAQCLSLLDEGRIALAALAVGLAQGCLDESERYARQRYAFARPIGDFQAIKFKIADMRVRAETARLAYYDAAARLLAGREFKQAAAIAKLYASECAMANARDATQIHGGYGFMNETPVARFYRDAKILEIGEGTSEVLRMIIARSSGRP